LVVCIWVSQAELIAQKRSANVRTDQQRLDSFSFKLSGENSYVLPVNMACRIRLAFVVRKECRHPVDAPQPILAVWKISFADLEAGGRRFHQAGDQSGSRLDLIEKGTTTANSSLSNR
jgi:hypothetical protein